MQPSDLTIEILKGIRDGVHATNGRLDTVTERLDSLTEQVDGLGVRIDTTNTRLEGIAVRLDRVERRQTETEVRLATELVAVVGAVHEVRDLIRERRAADTRIDDHERRIFALEQRP
jgi:hypothetical protein